MNVYEWLIYGIYIYVLKSIRNEYLVSLWSISLLAYLSMQYKLRYECPVKTYEKALLNFSTKALLNLDTKALLNLDPKALSKSTRKPC